MPDFVEVRIFNDVASDLCVSQSFDVLIGILLQEVVNLSALPEKVVLDHACEVNGPG